jgi:hypothetical protein
MYARYTHDCNHCKFLRTMSVEGVDYDWYECPDNASPGFSTIVARYGNDGPEYWSSMRSIIEDKAGFYGPTWAQHPMIAAARSAIAH